MAVGKISVVMSNYNDADYIGGAIRAVCEQSYPPSEVIVVDDGSTDNSVQVIKEKMAKYPAIRLVQNEVNRGTNYTANRGIALATGDLIYFASSNDEALPGLFEKSAKLLGKYPQAGLCCADMHFLNVSDGSSYRNPPNWLPAAGYLSPPEFAAATCSSNVPHPLTQTVIIRRSALLSELVYMPDLEWYADWFLIQVIALRHGCCYIPEPLALFRWFNRGYLHSGLQNRKYYRQVVTRIIRLLAAPEYEDVTELMIRGRSLQFIELHGRTPLTVLEAIRSVNRPNRHAGALFWYLTIEYLRGHCGAKALSSWGQKNLIKPSKEALHMIRGLVRNLFDRAYARLFHEYDRTRALIKRLIAGPF